MDLMKLYLFFFAVLLSFVSVNAQAQAAPPSCEIQVLAIEAALGDADAQYNLAVAFHQGEKVPQDLAKSAALWKMAAKAGVVSAYNNLGHLTYYGRGIKQNYAEGIRLWRVAATKGHSESLVHLAFAYADAKFLKIDYVEAYALGRCGKASCTPGHRARHAASNLKNGGRNTRRDRTQAHFNHTPSSQTPCYALHFPLRSEMSRGLRPDQCLR